jgi:hypothetical protein
MEEPDAIGWGPNGSELVECKVSRSDFMADQKKPWRRHEWTGLGDLRWYLTPPGLLKAEELPARWGLLETSGRIVRVLSKATPRERREPGMRSEIRLLLSVISRVEKMCGLDHLLETYTAGGKEAARALAREWKEARDREAEERLRKHREYEEEKERRWGRKADVEQAEAGA